jgi:hypothetical protein
MVFFSTRDDCILDCNGAIRNIVKQLQHRHRVGWEVSLISSTKALTAIRPVCHPLLVKLWRLMWQVALTLRHGYLQSGSLVGTAWSSVPRARSGRGSKDRHMMLIKLDIMADLNFASDSIVIGPTPMRRSVGPVLMTVCLNLVASVKGRVSRRSFPT